MYVCVDVHICVGVCVFVGDLHREDLTLESVSLLFLIEELSCHILRMRYEVYQGFNDA